MQETWYGNLNYFFLQLFFIRLAKNWDWETNTPEPGWRIIFRLPFTGWC